MTVLNSCVLHCVVAEGPYRVEHFRPRLNEEGMLKDTKPHEPYQMDRLRLMTLKTAEAKRRHLAAGEL